MNQDLNIGLIDGDSMVHILAHNHQEHRDISTVKASVDSFMEDICLMGCLDFYMGALKQRSPHTFRERHYMVRPYKGNRKEASEALTFWQPIILDYLEEEYGFIRADYDLEADDLIAAFYEKIYHEYSNITIFSPDKDLQQFPGIFKSYAKDGFISTISEEQADFNFWMQMLMGDSTDNITGIPGIGEKKAKTLLMENAPNYAKAVKDAYIKHFGGEHYGLMIFNETYVTLKLMTQVHPLYPNWEDYIDQLFSKPDILRKPKSRSQTAFMRLSN